MRHRNHETLVTTVPIKTMLEALKKNREGHKEMFDQALEGWKESVQEAAQDVLSAKDDKDEMLEKLQAMYNHGQPPMDQTDSYDSAIGMLEMSNDETIEITQTQYRCYVQDDWDWKEQWLGSNSAYVAKVGASAPRG
jgi:hypothetical protein